MMIPFRPDNSRNVWHHHTSIVFLWLAMAIGFFLPPSAHALETVTLQLKWLHQFQFAGFYAAKAKGYYREAGLDVNIVEHNTGNRAIDSVLEGSAQYGVDGPTLLLARGKGKPVVALGVIFQHSAGIMIVKQNSLTQNIRNLVGKRVMLESDADEMLAYFRKEGLSPSQFSLVKQSFNPQDLIDGNVDAISAYTTNEPFYLDKAGFRYLTFTPRSVGIDFYGDTLYTTEQEINAHPERVKAFREASLRGWKYAMAHPEEIVDLIFANYSQRNSREHLLFEARQMEELIQPDLIEVGYMNQDRWHNIAETYADLGMLPRNFSLNGFLYDPSPNHNFKRLEIMAGILTVFLAVSVGFVILLRKIVHVKTKELNITNRELTEQSNWISAIINGTTDAVFLKDTKGRYVVVNDELVRLFARPRSEIIGFDDTHFFPPTEAMLLMSGDKTIMEGGKVVTKEDHITFLDKEKVYQATKGPIHDESGSLIGLFGISRDITELKKVEETLERSKMGLRQIIDLIPEMLFVKDADGRFLLVNQTVATSYNLSVDELTGKLQAEIHPDKAEVAKMLANERQVIETGMPIFIPEESFLGADGHTRYLQTKKIPFYYAEMGKPTILGIAVDITDRKSSEEERLHFEQQLFHTQKLESLGVLAGGIAHDFNNILTSIIGNADLALIRITPESPAIKNLHKIEQAAARAADLAKQMLAYSGKGKFYVENLDMNCLLEEMLHMLEVSISKKVDLHLDLTPNLPAVEADATQMSQIVMNLVINASEAIGERNGVISIATGCIDRDNNSLKDIELDNNIKAGRYVFLEIADTGCGMDKETLAKIFDPFFTTKFSGRGLGMAVVLGIIRGHKGAIRVYSEPGKGTTFKILLPASDKQIEATNGETYKDDWHGSGRVLLVDDEETVRDIGTEMLKELGFTPITANDGREALEIFRLTPDIAFVILDMTMPQMDGQQCFRELKQLKPDVKVIICTGFSELEATQKFEGKGLAGFIQKPYKMPLLKKVIKEI